MLKKSSVKINKDEIKTNFKGLNEVTTTKDGVTIKFIKKEEKQC